MQIYKNTNIYKNINTNTDKYRLLLLLLSLDVDLLFSNNKKCKFHGPLFGEGGL